MAHLVLLLHGASLGGAQLSVLELLAALELSVERPTELRVTAILPEAGPLAEELQKIGVACHIQSLPVVSHSVGYSAPISVARLPVAALRNLRQLYQLRRLLAALAPTAVVCNSSALALCACLSRLSGYPTLTHIREVLPPPAHSVRSRAVLRAISRSSARVLVESDYNYNQVRPYVAAPKLRVISNWVDTDTFAPNMPGADLRASLGFAPADFVIAMAAQLIPEKGIYDLLQAAFILAAEDSAYKLLLIGDTVLVPGKTPAVDPRLSEQISNLGLDAAVTCVGVQRNPTRYLSVADAVVIAPRVAESFCRSVVEAMAMGKPVVSTDTGPIPELISDGRNGILIQPHAPLALAQAIKRIRNEPGLAGQLGAAAAATARTRFSKTAVLPQVWAAYRELLGL